MSLANRRKKDPSGVREAILKAAVEASSEHGFGSFSIDALARSAGVTKGAVFHHFANKQALLDETFNEMMKKVDAMIDDHIRTDPEPFGSFTRAYIHLVFFMDAAKRGEAWNDVCASMIADPHLRRQWAEWFLGRLQLHGEKEDAPALELVRLAAEGVWMADLYGVPLSDREITRFRLLSMTYPKMGSPSARRT